MKCKECHNVFETNHGTLTECEIFGSCTLGDEPWDLPEEKKECENDIRIEEDVSNE